MSLPMPSLPSLSANVQLSTDGQRYRPTPKAVSPVLKGIILPEHLEGCFFFQNP